MTTDAPIVPSNRRKSPFAPPCWLPVRADGGDGTAALLGALGVDWILDLRRFTRRPAGTPQGRLWRDLCDLAFVLEAAWRYHGTDTQLVFKSEARPLDRFGIETFDWYLSARSFRSNNGTQQPLREGGATWFVNRMFENRIQRILGPEHPFNRVRELTVFYGPNECEPPVVNLLFDDPAAGNTPSEQTAAMPITLSVHANRPTERLFLGLPGGLVSAHEKIRFKRDSADYLLEKSRGRIPKAVLQLIDGGRVFGVNSDHRELAIFHLTPSLT